MTSDLNPALGEAVRALGRTTTPDELRERGVASVRTISVGAVSRMIEQAVNQTLMERTINVDREELGRLVGQAEAAWKRILFTQTELTASRRSMREQRDELLDQLQALTDDRGEREPDRAAGAEDEQGTTGLARREDEALAEALRDWVRERGLAPDHGEESEDELVESAIEVLASVRASGETARRSERDREVSLLERRVQKLLATLEQTEATLERVQASRAIDVGLPSLYRVVRGLPDDEDNREIKEGLMASIFQANLTLRNLRQAE
jgi:hypothetical protein